MSARPWFPFYVGDYITDTMHLSQAHHGAYLLYLCHYWNHGALPASDHGCLAIARALSDVDADAALYVRNQFFQERDDGTWANARMDRERAKLEAKAEAGKRGGDAKAKHNPSKPPSKTLANDVANSKQSPSKSPSKTLVRACASDPDSDSDSDSDSESQPQSSDLAGGSQTTAPARLAKREPSKSAPTWEAYSAAYEHRYSVPPVRNARVNGQMAQFVQRVPIDEAPLIAAWYVASPNRWYVEKGHPVGLLLNDAEKLRTEAVTGERMTAARAITSDAKAERGAMWGRLIEKFEKENQLGH